MCWGVQVGFSKLDQPLIYSCMAMAKDRDVMANREHMLVTFEQVPPPPPRDAARTRGRPGVTRGSWGACPRKARGMHSALITDKND